MNRIAKASFWTFVSVFIILVSSASISAQPKGGRTTPTLWEDTALNPHDFTNDYYESRGIVGKAIIGRRTGSDGLSIFSNSSNPIHTDVRVIATVPAYDQNGDMLFWYPLGEIENYAFTDDKIGFEAREIAKMFPIYVFPHSKIQDFRLFANTRQAALMDNTWNFLIGGSDMNPLGFREIMFVTFTEKAYSEEGVEMMTYMAKKNGAAADDTPILRTMDDLRMMMKHDLVSTEPAKAIYNRYAVAPIIADPTNGVIAKDAFLWFATKDGSPLPTERMFSHQFGCLQKSGSWCKDE